jgi:AcrR family transcriptional regulator
MLDFNLTHCQTDLQFLTLPMPEPMESGSPCKRPYDLGRRQERSDRTRERVLTAAREQLKAGAVRDLTMVGLARASGVTRQTIHNLFGTKALVLEALFDRMALDAGMMRMRAVMTAPDGESMLAAMVAVFMEFWAKQRLVLKRIHGMAAIDPEFGKAVEARNQRRQGIAARVVERIYVGRPDLDPDLDAEKKKGKVAVLVALTSFEFFDALAASLGDADAAAKCVYPLVKKAMEAEV